MFSKKLNRRDIMQSLYIIAAATAILVILLLGVLYPDGLNVGGTMNYEGLFGFVIAVAMLMLSLFIFMIFQFKHLLKQRKYLIIVYTAIILTTVLCALFGRYVSPYARPVLLAALIVSIAVDSRLGLFVNFLVAILLFVCRAVLIVEPVVFESELAMLVANFITGSLTALIASKNRRRIDYMLVAVALSIINSLCAVAFAYIDIVPVNVGIGDLILYSMLSGFINILLFLGILPIFETGFNIVTSFRLGEMTNHDNALLKKLRETAPGTFNHSLIVGNITEACAAAIGENTYLARAAAYYHDIGKLKNPQYFIENQRTDQNPHDELSPELSMSFIQKHVTNGVTIARENNLPLEIISAIKEHHGTLVVKYFYYKAQQFTDGEVNAEDYSYEGPIPSNKISAIIMIADAAEAAIRSVKGLSEDKMKQLIQDLINERMRLGQFANCEITMRDLEIIKQTILDTFLGVYHERIQYPQVEIIKK
jgi:putative nucleotidyltransferase with HDIG domain